MIDRVYPWPDPPLPPSKRTWKCEYCDSINSVRKYKCEHCFAARKDKIALDSYSTEKQL